MSRRVDVVAELARDIEGRCARRAAEVSDQVLPMAWLPLDHFQVDADHTGVVLHVLVDGAPVRGRLLARDAYSVGTQLQDAAAAASAQAEAIKGAH